MSRNSPGASPRDVGVLIAAGGVGERAGGATPKQFRPIGGVPMLLRAIRPFASHPRVREIVVAVPAPYAEHPPDWLSSVVGAGLRLVAGGATRTASVRAALEALCSDCAIVLVHDAARPFVARETVDAVIAVASEGLGAVPAVPVGDTLKRCDQATGRIAQTVDRHGLWRAQTPQGFPRHVLTRAFDHAATDAAGDGAASDDAALVEAAGHPVRLVRDLTSNIKVTTPEDFAIAEALAAR